MVGCHGIEQPQIQRRFSPVARNLEHIVFFGRNAATADCLRPFQQQIHHHLELRRRRRDDNAVFAVFESRTRQIEHLRRLHIGKVAELGQQFRQIDEPGKARVHPVARSSGRQLQCRHRFTKIGSPSVELRHTSGIQCLGIEVALHGVQFRHGIGDRRPCCKHHTLFLIPLPQPARLDVHVRGAIACAVGQPCHTSHLGNKAEVFVQISFIHKDTVNAHFLEANGLVFFLAFGAVFDLLGQAFLRGFQHLDDATIALIDIGFADGFFQCLQFRIHIGVKQFIRHRE